MLGRLNGRIRESLEQAVIKKLYFEWDQVVWGLGLRDAKLAAGLSRPGILITDMKKNLGEWDARSLEIRLSRQFVQKARWDSILEVLWHEIAHQLAATFPEYRLQTAHGSLFIECCRILGANPKASGTYKTLEQRVFEDGANDNDRIMIKVKKLMNLASSANCHEAELAAAKAGQLIARYNIDEIGKDRKRDFESIIISDPTLKRSQAESLGATLLKKHYFVKPVWIPIYIPEKEKMGRALEISGTATNIKIADYVFSYILNYAKKSWLFYKNDNPTCRARSGYMTGVVLGFLEKLDMQQKQMMEPAEKTMGKALVAQEDKRLARYFYGRHVNIKKTRISHQTSSRDAYDSGKKQGKQLVVAKAISSEGKPSGRVLGMGSWE